MQKRVGIYAWAGPGTIRLLETKYVDPKIDRESFLHAYDLPYLTKLKTLFDVTDAWVTYSWGFSDQTEQEDSQFLRQKLSNFKKLGIKTHAYIQGFNVVTDKFKEKDFFCQDAWGRKIAYSKERSFICPNHPDTVRLLTDRVRNACKEDIDGIFIDNILFGLPPFTVSSDLVPFFGCSCQFCQEKFESQFGYPLPRTEKRGAEIKDYLQFRADSCQAIVQRLAEIVHRHRLQFGINLYDPSIRLDTLYYGYSMDALSSLLDYHLIENHSLADEAFTFSNKETNKPVFVVSYDHGIGYEPQFSQEKISRLFSQAQSQGYFPCLKTTEFTTDGIWHVLRLHDLKAPETRPISTVGTRWKKKAKQSSFLQRLLIGYASRQIIRLIQASQENTILSEVTSHFGIHKKQVRKPRITAL